MSGLFTTIRSATGALQAYSAAMTTVQQNLLNASTPGYARQSATLVDVAFDPLGGQTGGVRFAGTQSARDNALETTVRYQQSQSGKWQTQTDKLKQIVDYLDAGGSSADLGTAISSLFTQFQGWANNPNDTPSKTNVLTQAKQVAVSFNDVAKGLSDLRDTNISDLKGTVEKINALADHLAALRPGDSAGEADLYNSLQQLSELAGITVGHDQNGVLTVSLGAGQTPLVANGQAMHISVDTGTDGLQHVTSSTGRDITATMTDGKLGAQLNISNDVLVGILGNGTQPGTLNLLARTLADAIDNALGGTQFFTYNRAGITDTAATLQVNPNLDESNLNADSTTLQSLLGLAGAKAGGSSLGDLGFNAYYEAIVNRAAGTYSSSQATAKSHAALLEQGETLRQRVSGADTSTEAVNLLQIQQAYQATTKVISSVNDMIDTVLAMVR